MKVFVAGGTGVVGRRALPLLVERGHEVTALARSAEKAAQVRAAGATPVEVSLFDPEGLGAAVAGHDAVVNVATKIPSTFKMARRKAWAENDRIRGEGAANLARAALHAGASRFVQESVAFVYAEGGDRWLDESAPLGITDLLESTLAAERAAGRFTEAGATGIVLRFGLFYAPDSGHVVDMVRSARRGMGFLPGSRDGYVSPVHADDAAPAVVAALEHAPAGVWNVCDDDPLTREELHEAFARQVGRQRLRPVPGLVSRFVARGMEHGVRSQRLSNAAFKASTGWAPRYPSMRDGLPGVVAAIEDTAPAA